MLLVACFNTPSRVARKGSTLAVSPLTATSSMSRAMASAIISMMVWRSSPRSMLSSSVSSERRTSALKSFASSSTALRSGLERSAGPRAVPSCAGRRMRLPNLIFEICCFGEAMAEMLVRAGIKDIALVDKDLLEAGNVCRHMATLVDVGKTKVQLVAQRLRQISPVVRVTEMNEELPGDAKAIVAQFDEYEIIIDCTSSDEVLALLSRCWWSIPRVFASFSLGYGRKRVFSFGVSGHQFPQQGFLASVRPWLEHEAKAWANTEELLEGAGCWSPLFPARYDDVVLAATTCVKELETLVSKKPLSPRFRVFAQSSSDDGFQGLVPESAPPAVDAPRS